jgi:hypothetical protein
MIDLINKVNIILENNRTLLYSESAKRLVGVLPSENRIFIFFNNYVLGISDKAYIKDRVNHSIDKELTEEEFLYYLDIAIEYNIAQNKCDSLIYRFKNENELRIQIRNNKINNITHGA